MTLFSSLGPHHEFPWLSKRSLSVTTNFLPAEAFAVVLSLSLSKTSKYEHTDI